MTPNEIKILAVDDEVNFADFIFEYFSARGYPIDTAQTPMDALSKFEKNKYSVVLLDFKIPGMHGDELMEKMLKIDPTVKVIIITAFNDSAVNSLNLLKKGACAYVEKPIVSIKHLETIINDCLKS
ncbi:MAG: response regulator [Candidatus Omnitrophica bacterium]|nr:response regulator [Candidatus Omnitrophota bacterium]